jgi:uncharacterized protein (DUF362 family)/NAD-dependent dihydropyrimidine dehydrogenase PreA subunit
MEKSAVAVVRCESYDRETVYAAVSRGISLLGGIHRFVKPGERILLKPNILAAAKPEEAVTTHPAVFSAVARALLEGGATVSYGDSPGFGKSADVLSKCGLTAAADELGLSLADFERSRNVEYPDGVIAKRFDLALGALDCDGIVSLPKMKAHQLTRITGAVKNQFGCVQGLNKAAFHVRVPNQVNFSKMLVDLNKMLPMRLFVMDGIMAMEGNGPRGGTPVPMNCLILSSDPVAIDATFCRMIGLDPRFVPYLPHGTKRGLGQFETNGIEYVGDDPSSFANPSFDVVRKPVVSTAGKRYIPSVIRNALFPRPVIDPASCVRCGVCAESCPVGGKALSFRDGTRKNPPTYDYNACIRCYCCQEMCPYGAITVRK